MTSRYTLIPKVGDGAAAKDDGKDKGNTPSYHYHASDNRNNRELSDRKDAVIEKKERKFYRRDCTRKSHLGSPVDLLYLQSQSFL